MVDILHMSGECLCGAFAHPGELEEIRAWFPNEYERIKALERRACSAGVPCEWGVAPPEPVFIDPDQTVMPLCVACENKGI